ncbi:MAG TPA: L-rhamnose/proton symporter RhaT [Candidatus Limnocylindrales bacterium]|nr:L-rhamnose/proton symporter RhaT [Candidatus Limnocylindrales bacterium]
MMLGAVLLVLLAGVMNGSWATPMKRVRGWQWEHIWLAWAFLGMLVIPLVVAAATVPSLPAVYRMAGPEPLVRTALYGMFWGAGAVLFGLGITRVGLALGFGIILGVGSSLGAVVPFVKFHRDRLFTTTGLLTFVGVTIILAGVSACARAGLLREAATPQKRGEGSFVVGLIICVLSGLGTTFMSLALNEAVPIFASAETLGMPSTRSLNAVWPVLLGGGLVVNAAYCLFLIIRRRSVAHFREATVTNVTLAAVMAVLWSGSNFVYGAGARGMGTLGLVLGWPVFMAAIVLTANAWGVLTGEWRGATTRTITWAGSGCLLLVAGVVLIAGAGRTS